MLSFSSRRVSILFRRLASTSSSSSSSDSIGAKTTHFGYDTVTEEEKASRVQGVFSNVASKYDLMNDAMSLGVHRCWKDQFVAKLDPGPTTKLLDVAGGTGDIAFRVLNAMHHRSACPTGQIIVCDINPDMLQMGQDRSRAMGVDEDQIRWTQGDAMKLPFEDQQFDAYTIAFGIRNVVRIEEALSEAYRVLKPGGRFMCLEFSRVENPVVSALYDLYSFQVIPPLGKVLASDWDSYQYLVESIRQFPDQTKFAGMIRDAGFRAVEHQDLSFGVAAIHSGFKL